MSQPRRSSSTLPSLPSRSLGQAAAKSGRAKPSPANGRPKVSSQSHSHLKTTLSNAPVYVRMQDVVQKMLHSEHGVPIKSHKRRIISAIPSAFTGADVVNWLFKNLSMDLKAEAIHLANLLCHNGYFFCIEGVGIPVRDDGTLFRFQTPYYWPSQNPDISDFAYGVYLVKQVLRSKQRIRLLDYELKNLHKLKLRLAKEWKVITENAEDDVKVFREQKRVAKAIISSQEEAFWRLYRPPPGETCVQDSALTRHSTEQMKRESHDPTEQELREELAFLKATNKGTKAKVSTAVENMQTFCDKYEEFDPMLTSPGPSNPWITGDDTLWTLDKSLIEYPSEKRVKKWACSFQDLLTDVTGRFKFEQYCKSQFNLENVRFFQACRDLKSIPLAAVNGSVQLVYDEFLQRGAESEVNVSASVQEEIEADLIDPSRFAFSGAEEQIYKLMQNDIYPRFLKSPEYQELLRKGKEVDEAGKGFFAKLQRKKFDVVKQDASGISPCLPQRYTKRQLSISRKIGSTGGSSSLDDLFLACSDSGAGNPFAMETKRNSAYTEAFIDSLMEPDPSKMMGTGEPQFRQRRISAPEAPPTSKPRSRNSSSFLEDISEQQYVVPPMAEFGGLETGLPMSYSADDMQQLMEDADSIGASKWKKFGIAAGIEFSDAGVGPMFGSPLRSKSDHTHCLAPADHLALPLLEMSSSPRYGKGAFEYESLDIAQGGRFSASSDSIHSTSSH